MVDTPGCYSHSLRGGAVSQRPLREEMMRLRLPSLNTYDKDVFIIFCRACCLRRLTYRLLLLTEVQNTKMQLHTDLRSSAVFKFQLILLLTMSSSPSTYM